MKIILKRLLLLVCCRTTLVYGLEEIAVGNLRAYFVMPVAHALTLEGCWIEIVAVAPGGAERVVERVRGMDLKLRGGVRVFPDSTGSMALGYRSDPEANEVVVARALYEGGWYRRAELCGGSESPDPSCRYLFERDSDNQSLSLHLFMRR